MSYQALYRVWRPQTFDEMVGQNIIRETLKNAIKSKQISHAYLFTGPRGTGKTSAAKIVAKAINCPNQTDGNPCNSCEMCRLITEGQIGDVIEIDAASNNGVDEIRDLRENVRYAASEAEYKVYIIDEVHMLTTGAFNALLKTLEEPPEHVIFILATTEPHKIPATILSRTQRFDFQRITNEDLISRMEEVLETDSIPYVDEALAIIARAANGGMRDSLSLLDQALSYNPAEVTMHSALEVSGSLNQLDFVDYIQAVYQQESETALEIVQEQLQLGKQASRFIEELILFSRDMLLSHHTNENQTLLNNEEIQSLQAVVPADYYYQLIDQLNDTQNKMRFTNQPDLFVEVMTIQLAQNYKTSHPTEEKASASQEQGGIKELITTIRQLEEALSFLTKRVEGQEEKLIQLANSQSSERPRQSENDVLPEKEIVPRQRPVKQQQLYQLELDRIHHVLNNATHEHIRVLKEVWPKVLQDLSPQDRVKFSESEPLAAGEGYALVSFVNRAYCGDIQQNKSLLNEVIESINRYAGQSMTIVCIVAEEWGNVRKNYTLLRKQNNGQPIPVNMEKVNSETEVEQSVTNTNTDVKEDSPSQQAEETKQGIDRIDETAYEALNNGVAETQPEDETPEIVKTAIQIFGEDNINVHYN